MFSFYKKPRLSLIISIYHCFYLYFQVMIPHTDRSFLMHHLKSSSPPKAPPKSIILSVSEVNQKIQHTLHQNYPLVFVAGEIANFQKNKQGHIYFTLKDAKSCISCTIFAQVANGLNHADLLKNGVAITVKGQVQVYIARGSYQINVQKFRLEGEGALKQKLEQLKKKLHAEGLFDIARKKLLPQYPLHIAVISSPNAAGLQDFLKTIHQRFPMTNVHLFPSAVQGEKAHLELIAALDRVANEPQLELAILCRGGGSLEDLWSFNEPDLIYRIAQMHIPCISAVGHETDFTLCDHVCDIRAATPTHAAMLCVPESTGVIEHLKKQQQMLHQQIKIIHLRAKERLHIMGQKIIAHHPLKTLQAQKIKLEQTHHQLLSSTHGVIHRFDHTLQSITPFFRSTHLLQQLTNIKKQSLESKKSQLLDGLQKYLILSRQRWHNGHITLLQLHPRSALKRGFCLLSQNGKPITSASAIQQGLINIDFKDQSVSAHISDVKILNQDDKA